MVHLIGAYFYTSTVSAILADTDGDGRMEFITAPPLQIHERQDDGSFERTFLDALDWLGERPVLSRHGGSIAAGDLDGDGRMEIGTFASGGLMDVDLGADGVGSTGTSVLRLLQAQGDDTYALLEQRRMWAEHPKYAAVGDVDGDGDVEFAFGSGLDCQIVRIVDAAETPGGEIFRWTFDPARPYPSSPFGYREGIAFGDMDGDGDDELAVAVGPWVGLFEWADDTMNLRFAAEHCPECYNTSVLFADLNGDGRESLVVTAYHEGWDIERDWTLPYPDGIHIYERVLPE